MSKGNEMERLADRQPVAQAGAGRFFCAQCASTHNHEVCTYRGQKALKCVWCRHITADDSR